MKTISTVLLLVALAAPAALAQSKTGTTIGAFLKIEPSARIAGMGNAGVTIMNDLQGTYYNPAAIGDLTGYGVQFTHSPWLADIAYNYATVGLAFEGIGSFFASVTHLGSGEIDVRTVEKPLGTGERYSVTNLAFGLGYGRRISEQFALGVQVTFLNEQIWNSSLSAWAFSVGTIYRTGRDGLTIGASIANFGTAAQYDGRDLRILYDANPDKYGDNGSLPGSLLTDDFPLPIVFRLGVGMPVMIGDENRLTWAVDAFHPSDNTESVSFGAEWVYQELLALRLGYQNLFMDDSEVGLTAGAGVRYWFDDRNGVMFDYAWADHGRLEQTHRITVGVLF
jgi:hypothetical protein